MAKKAENPVDFSLIAIALVSRTVDMIKFSEGGYFRSHLQSLAEYEVGDLVVNVSDVYANEDCLDRVGTVLEIREDAIEIRCLDGITRCAIAKSSTYIAAKGVKNVSA